MAIGDAAKARATAVVLFVDELQYVRGSELGAPITAADVTEATRPALAELDAGFFRVRLDRLSPSEKLYLRAMAQLGPGPHRSGRVAEALGKTVREPAAGAKRARHRGQANR